MSEDLLTNAGMFWPVQQITRQNKENIVAGTFARLHGIDIEAGKAALGGDQFSRGATPDFPSRGRRSRSPPTATCTSTYG